MLGEIFAVQAIFSLMDNLTGPLERIQRGLGDTERLTDRLSTRFLTLGKAMLPLAAAAGVVLGAFGHAAAEAAAFDEKVTAAGTIADMTRGEVEALTSELDRLSLVTRQGRDSLLEGMQTLLGKGMDKAGAAAMLEQVGRAATATKSDINDLATTTYALVDNLKIAPETIGKSLDILAQAGKEGSFELKAMARHFPNLTAAAQNLGMQGEQAAASLAAALQVAMKGAGSEDIAANNFKNFLAKITAPETVKRFAEQYGVNLKSQMELWTRQGLDPVREMAGLVQSLTGGDQFEMSKLFGDQQALDFLKPMLANLEEFDRIKEKSLGASGVVDKDFETMISTAAGAVNGMTLAVDSLQLTIGRAFLPVLQPMARGLMGAAEALSRLGNSPAGQFILRLTAGVAAAVVALTGLSFLAAAVSAALPILAGGFGMLAGAVGAVAWPVLLLAGAAWLLWQAWDSNFMGIRDTLMQFWDDVSLVVQGVRELFANLTGTKSSLSAGLASQLDARGLLGVVTGIGKAFVRLREFFSGLWDGLAPLGGELLRALQPAIETVGAAFEAFWSVLSKVMQALGLADVSSQASSWREWGQVLGSAVVAGLTAVATVLGWVVQAVAGVAGGIFWLVDAVGQLAGRFAFALSQAVAVLGNIGSAIASGFGAAIDGVVTAVGRIATAFGQLGSQILTALQTMWGQVVAWLSGINLSAAGAALIQTFVDGILSRIQGAYEAVKSGVQMLRNLLPGSDAKEGPLSTLTASGTALVTTFGQGIQAAGASPLVAPLTQAMGQAADVMGQPLPMPQLGTGLDMPLEQMQQIQAMAGQFSSLGQASSAATSLAGLSLPSLPDLTGRALWESVAPTPPATGTALGGTAFFAPQPAPNPVTEGPRTLESRRKLPGQARGADAPGLPGAGSGGQGGQGVSGGRQVIIRSLNITLPDVQDAQGFVTALQRLVDQYDA